VSDIIVSPSVDDPYRYVTVTVTDRRGGAARNKRGS
jgi:hypothetical protein